jgi:hypothetical protein
MILEVAKRFTLLLTCKLEMSASNFARSPFASRHLSSALTMIKTLEYMAATDWRVFESLSNDGRVCFRLWLL